MRERDWSKSCHVMGNKINWLTMPTKVTVENFNQLTFCWPSTFRSTLIDLSLVFLGLQCMPPTDIAIAKYC